MAALTARVRSGAKGKLSATEIREFHALYKRAAADLAYVQSNISDEELLEFLNDLVAAAHSAVYVSERAALRQVAASLLHGPPTAFRKRFRYVALAAVLMLAAAGVGGILVWTDPTWLDTLLPPVLRLSVESWKTGTFPEATGTERFVFMAGLNLNNSLVALIVAGSGFTFGILTAWFIGSNGAVLGAVVAEVGRAGQLGHLLSGIAIHAVPEFAALLIAGGVGFMIADAIIRPGPETRADALRDIGPDCFWMLALSLVLLLLAAILEAYVSHSALPPVTKMGLACGALLGLAGYLIGYSSHQPHSQDNV